MSALALKMLLWTGEHLVSGTHVFGMASRDLGFTSTVAQTDKYTFIREASVSLISLVFFLAVKAPLWSIIMAVTKGSIPCGYSEQAIYQRPKVTQL